MRAVLAIPPSLRRARTLPPMLLLTALLCGAASSLALPEGHPDADVADRQRLAAQWIRTVDVGRIRALSERLAAQPAVAGTPAMQRESRRLANLLRSWGLQVQVYPYDVWMPHAVSVRVEQLSPVVRRLPLDGLSGVAVKDSRIRGDAAGYPPVAGYAAAGDVTGSVVFAGYGRQLDFESLARAGIPLDGRVALIRYGGLFRGNKVANAERAGAAAVLLYSDPADGGTLQGPAYPAGPFLPGFGLQRGSVNLGPPGDPTTPGWPSVPGAAHVAPGPGPAKIPVVILSADAAQMLLGPAPAARSELGTVAGTRTGPVPFDLGVRVRVVVRHGDNTRRRIYDTVATLPGRLGNGQIVVGAHRDTWSYGATDNVSGTVAVLECARVLAAAARATGPPLRTLTFAFWDAEEWGLIGSAEWIEQHEQQGGARVIAYLNQDGIAGGPWFSAIVSPSLRRVLGGVAADVPDPILPGRSVLEAALRRSEQSRLSLLLPGGGSDYASFSGRLGSPVAGFGFAGESGLYHSSFDTLEYLRRFGDPGYRQHLAATRMLALLAWRLADDPVLPLRLDDLAGWLAARAARYERQFALADESLVSAARRLRRAAERLQRTAAAHHAEAAARRMRRDDRQIRTLDAAILDALQKIVLGPESLPDPSWQRNRLFATANTDAYRSQPLPQVAAAIARGDASTAGRRLQELSEAVEQAARELSSAEPR